VPFVAYVLLVMPALNRMADDDPDSFGSYVGELDAGPLWFVGALLLFSFGYVAWRAARRRPSVTRPVGLPDLVSLAAVVAVASFVVRLVFPMNSEQVFMIHVWQWPQCIGLFALGITAAERGGLEPVPADLARMAGRVALVGTTVMVIAFGLSHDEFDPYAGGWTWQATVTAVCEGAVAVALSVWLLGRFQRRHDRTDPFRRAAGRAAFGAYVLQAPVLVLLALAVQDLDLAPELKFLVVAPFGVTASFALAWVLTRLPGVRRVL
jgi:hypothetical protein